MEEEDAALESLLNDIYGDNPQTEEQGENLAPTEHIQEEVQEHPQEQPQVDTQEVQRAEQVEAAPTVPVDTNKELIEKLMQMQEQTAQQNQMLMQELQKKDEVVQQLSEEDIAMQELKSRLGLDKVEQENQLLKQQLEQVMKANETRQQQEQMREQQAQYQEQLRMEVSNFKKEFPDVQEDVIIDYIKMQPKDVQHQFDTPQGWRMIATILKAQAKPVNVPDAITTTQSSSMTTSTASSRKKAGENVSDTDIAMELLGLTR